MYLDDNEKKAIASFFVVALFSFAFIFLVKPTKDKVELLQNPTIFLQSGGEFQVASDKPISLSAVSIGPFVLEVDGRKLISTEQDNKSYSIPEMEGHFENVEITISEEKVGIEMISEGELEITQSRSEAVLFLGLLFFFLLFLVLAFIFVA